MKRQISALLILATLLTACGSNGSAPDTTDDSANTSTPSENPVTDRLDELGEHDFGKKKFTILDANDYPEWHVNMHDGTINGDIVNDALYERDLAIEDRYNVDIEYVQMTKAGVGIGAMKSSVLAGDDEYTMCISLIQGGNLGTVMADGVLANLCDNDYLSLDSDWWSKLFYKNLKLGDKLYFTTGDISPTMYQIAQCLYLNTRLAEDYKIDTDEICELVRGGKWTLDELILRTKGLNQDLNDDGVMDPYDDFFGLAINCNSTNNNLPYFVIDAGVSPSKLTADGKSIEIDLMNDRTLTVLDKVKNLAFDNNRFDDQWAYINKAFKEGRALFMYHYTESAQNFLRDMTDDYMVLPMPKGDANQDDYHTYVNCWADAFVAIPATADPEFAGVITEALAYYSWKNIRSKAYDLTYKQKTSRDENSAEMLDIVFNTLCVDFNYIYDFGGTYSSLADVASGKAQLASAMAANGERANTEIEKFVESWLG